MFVVNENVIDYDYEHVVRWKQRNWQLSCWKYECFHGMWYLSLLRYICIMFLAITTRSCVLFSW